MGGFVGFIDGGLEGGADRDKVGTEFLVGDDDLDIDWLIIVKLTYDLHLLQLFGHASLTNSPLFRVSVRDNM